MKKSSLVLAVCLVVLVLGACTTTSHAVLAPAPSSKRDYSVPVASAGIGKSFYLMRTEQLHPLPAGSTIGVISGDSSLLPMYIEADLEAKGFTVRQVDIYNLVTPRQKNLTDPSGDFVFINTLAGSISQLDKETTNSTIEKLMPADSLYVENQLTDHYLSLIQDLKKMVASLNVDYLVVVGPAYKELSYALKIYDANKFDLVFTCLFVGDEKNWRSIVGVPQKNVNLSYDFEAASEPPAFWDMAFSRYATDKIKTDASTAAPVKAAK